MRRPLKRASPLTWMSFVLVSVQTSIQAPGDPWLTSPVDGRTFQTYLEFFAYDRDLSFDLDVIDSEEREGILTEHLSFQSTPGLRVFANFYRPATTAWRDRPTVIFLHGGTGDGKDAPHYGVLALFLVRGGLNVLAIDMLHFGERRTGLLTTFTEEDKHSRLYNQPSTYLQWVIQTVKDVGRAYDLLVTEKGADPKRIGLVGNSRGAQMAAIVGGAERRLAAVVMSYGGHFDALERGHLPAACPANYIARISPRPLLMINGIYDADYSRETSVLPLQRHAGEPKTILWAETGHQLATMEHRSAMLSWLLDKLK